MCLQSSGKNYYKEGEEMGKKKLRKKVQVNFKQVKKNVSITSGVDDGIQSCGGTLAEIWLGIMNIRIHYLRASNTHSSTK